METLIGAALIGLAIVVAALVYGRSRPAAAAAAAGALPTTVGDGRPAPDDPELVRRTAELERSAARTQALEAALDRRGADLDRREAELERRDQHLRARATELESCALAREEALERIAGLSAGQAKQALLKDVEDQARHDVARASCARSRRRPSATPSAACASSSPSRCSAWPPATRPRRRCRSSSCPPTT